MSRVVVIQPYVARYRSSFFTALQQSLHEHDMSLIVVSGRGPTARADNDMIAGQIVARDWLGPLTGDRARLRVARFPDPDLVIIEHAVKNLESYPLLVKQHRGGVPVAMWGHGSTRTRARRRWLDRGKDWFTLQADWFFAYTESGASSVSSIGFPSDRVTVVRNSVDTSALRSDLDAISVDDVAGFARQWGLQTGRVGLFLGRLEKDKGIDYLAEVADQLRATDPRFTLLVGGSGPQAARLSGKPNVRMLGRLDGRAKAVALRASDLLLVPTWIGLIAVESLAAGVPIVTITGNRHMPEIDYLSPGRNAVMLEDGCSATRYAAEVSQLLDQPHQISRLRERGLKDASTVSLEIMVENFRNGLLEWRSRISETRSHTP